MKYKKKINVKLLKWTVLTQKRVAWSNDVRSEQATTFCILCFAGTIETDEEGDGLNSLVTRYKLWVNFKTPCAGKYSNGICIFAIGDLSNLGSTPKMFANKFHMDYHPLALDCMEKHIIDKVLIETKGKSHFNDSYYKTFDFVKNHI